MGANHAPGGGRAFLVARLPLPLVYFLAPYPPAPLPRRGRGRLRLFSCKGLRPLHPTVCGTYRACQAGARRGGLPSLLPAYPAFSLLFCPLSPRPPSPVGKGENITLISPGATAPGTPAFNRLRHLQSLPSRYQTGVCLRRRQFGAKPTGSGSLRAEPAAKERGDRGRGTSAFEMVLSPGAGRASAAGFQPPADTTAAGAAGNKEGTPHRKQYQNGA